MVIQAKIDNSPELLNFILDTGSSGISLDSTTCSNLNIYLQNTDTVVTGIGGAKKVSFAFNRKLIVGNLATDSLNFYVNDYSLLSSVYGEKIDGIVGYSFLSRYIFDVNVDSATIKIYSNGNFKYKKNKNSKF